MNKLSAAAMGVAALALILAIVALTRTPEFPPELAQKIDATAGEIPPVKQDVTLLQDDQMSLKQDLASIKSNMGRQKAPDLSEVNARIAELEKKIATLQEGADRWRRYAEAMRQRFQGNQRGGNPQDAQARAAMQQRFARLDMAKVPQVAKDAAVKAVEGFKHDHSHNGGKTDDGKDVFTFHGRAGDKSYEVKVAADGTVISKNVRQNRTRGRRPQQRPQTQPRPNQPADDAPVF